MRIYLTEYRINLLLADLLTLPSVKFFMLFCRLLIFFQYQLFRKILSGIPSECQTDWIEITPTFSDLGPICLQRLSADDKKELNNMSTVYMSIK